MIKKIKLLLTTLSVINKLKGAGMKSGIKTTEFWLSILAISLQVWMAVNGLIPAEISAWIVALVTAVWVGFRTIAKITKSTKDDELIAKIEELLKKQAGQS
jgi:hypothetical protein